MRMIKFRAKALVNNELVYGEAECKRRGIHQLLSDYYTNSAEYAGVCCKHIFYRGALTNAGYGFPPVP